MPNFNYEAISSSGKQFKGTMNADNIDDLEYKLKEIGLELINHSLTNVSSLGFGLSKKIKGKDLILLCTHFEQLDKAGVPITQAIEDLRDSEDNNKFRDLMQDIYESVKSGKMLSEAMAEYPRTFDELFVGLVKAGEKTGNLSRSFAYLGEHLKWSEEIKRKTKKAIRYPIFLLVVVFAVTAIMMIIVIPKLSEFLLKQEFDLPFYTQALIDFSGFFQNNWQLMIAFPIVFYIINKILYKTIIPYAYMMDRVVLSLPYIGNTMLKIDVARFSQFFLITFKSGIDVIDCFTIVEKVVNNKVIKQSISEISQDISEGNSISNSLRLSEKFPNLVIRMFEVGEKTGNMEDSLKNIKFFYDKEVNDSVEAMVGVIQPTLTLIMGLLLLWISLSVFGPLYSSFSQIR
jgi:type IV pilus assembly protein PilC